MMTTTKKTTALAIVDNFQLIDRYEGVDPELMAELQDELSDLDPESGITCRQIKVPSGGGIAYEVQGEDEDDAEPMKEIQGVIVFTHRLSGYWPGSFGSAKDARDKIPVCSSMDGKTGFNPVTGEVTTCETCPHNQYGTGIDDKGNPSKGKACKNMRRIYLLMDDDPNLYLLSVPPTSIKDVNKQLAKILASGTPYTGIIVSFTLEKVKNSNGVEYSKVVVKRSGLLPAAIAAQVAQLRGQIKQQYQSLAITLDDYATAPDRNREPGNADPAAFEEAPAPSVEEAVFEEVPAPSDDDLPFA